MRVLSRTSSTVGDGVLAMISQRVLIVGGKFGTSRCEAKVDRFRLLCGSGEGSSWWRRLSFRAIV